ncbi:MAG: glycosyltransferase [Clostridia bacterium]|nr:glycosyltransferase [Clostridia bacterium]
MERLHTTLVIPMYNESDILPQILPRVCAYMKEAFPDGYEILFSDDGSTDNSVEIVEKYGDPATRVLRSDKNHGKGHAVRRGILAARGKYIVFTDCDLAYGTAVIGRTVAFLSAYPRYGAVIGSRDLHPQGYEGYSLLRRAVSRAYRLLLRLFFGLHLSDSQSGIKGFTAEAAEKIFPLCRIDRYAFDFEAIAVGERRGVHFGEMPVRVIENRPGRIRLVRDSVRMLRDLGRVRQHLKRIPKEKP